MIGLFNELSRILHFVDIDRSAVCCSLFCHCFSLETPRIYLSLIVLHLGRTTAEIQFLPPRAGLSISFRLCCRGPIPLPGLWWWQTPDIGQRSVFSRRRCRKPEINKKTYVHEKAYIIYSMQSVILWIVIDQILARNTHGRHCRPTQRRCVGLQRRLG